MINHSHPPPDPAGYRGCTALDELFEALSQPPRRRILTALSDASRRDEAEFVPTEFIRNEQCTDRLQRLHHAHIPKLVDSGFIDWDPDSETITRGPRFDEIAPVVELMTSHQQKLPADWP